MQDQIIILDLKIPVSNFIFFLISLAIFLVIVYLFLTYIAVYWKWGRKKTSQVIIQKHETRFDDWILETEKDIELIKAHKNNNK